MEPLDISQLREDFPILSTTVYNRPLVYLDNAATTQKPRAVVEAEREMYYAYNANVHRGVHYLSEQATQRLEDAREVVRNFIHAQSVSEIVFTRGTTEGINLVASSFGERLREGDEVILSTMEHHSNIVPWQLLRDRKNIRLRIIPMTDEGELVQEEFERLFTNRTRLVAVTHVSNVLGTVNPVKQMAAVAHAHGVPILVDAAQSVPHMEVDVQDLDCDFLCFSGHKVYGPTGIGVLYGKEKLLESMPPYQAGGEMISTVSFEKTTFERLPYKFEAGTPNYVGSYALSVALKYAASIGMSRIAAYEQDLCRYATLKMQDIEGVRIYGTSAGKEAVISFLVDGIHHLDMGTLLDRLGIAVRTGHHCAEPLMHRLGIEGTVRASFSLYNTRDEVDALAEGIKRVKKMFV
ncbi:MAG: cysteine desulfurase [Bacteroidaceae bacterium]|nr:cysteine desulfurase [Bacteroidaceae bacterium]